MYHTADWQRRLGFMGPFLPQKVVDSNSKHGPWNPEKLIPVHALIERYDKKEGLLTTISRKKLLVSTTVQFLITILFTEHSNRSVSLTQLLSISVYI